MLTVTNLSRSFGSQTVLDAVNWFVPAGARVGLVGANGAGKSTLLRMIAGVEAPDDGSIIVPKGTTIGYLPQEVMGLSGRTVRGEALDAFADILALERRCRDLEESLAQTAADDPAHAGIMEAYARAREEWDAQGRYDYESQAEEVLVGLGFRPADFGRDTGEFSGGWQMRLALAKLLLRQPTLLLLDEPTNHLDIEARNWLEAFLRSYPHTVILVAHDRYFLDVTVDRITEISRGRLTDYASSYSQYLIEKEDRRAREIEAYREQQEEIARIEAFISRFRYQASKAALVQSRIKQLEKMPRREPPDGDAAAIHFRFPPAARSGRIVLELRGVEKRYGDLVVYAGLDLAIERGRKVALVGPNGAGKSTLIRLLAGVDPPSTGTRRVGHNVTIGYFAQDQSGTLDAESTVLEEVTRAAPFDLVPQVRDLLGAFLFRGDSVHKRVKVLSGGERNRLALAKLLLQPSNCLLLDEPTNHLDLYAKEVLLESLQQYRGALVLVAHDRYLLDHLVEEVIEVGAGHAIRHLGNYEDYLRATGERMPSTSVAVPPPRAPVVDDRGGPRTQRAAARPAAPDRERARLIADLEHDILAKETELATLSATINAPDFYHTHATPHAMFSRYAQLRKAIEKLYAKLERLERDGQQSAPPLEP